MKIRQFGPLQQFIFDSIKEKEEFEYMLNDILVYENTFAVIDSNKGISKNILNESYLSCTMIDSDNDVISLGVVNWNFQCIIRFIKVV